MTSPSTTATATIISVTTILLSLTTTAHSLGSATTVSATFGSTTTICAIVAGQPSQRIQCWQNGHVYNLFSNVSFQSIAGGRDVICGIRSGGSTLICWNPSLVARRLHLNKKVPLRQIAIGDRQICAITENTNRVECWRDGDQYKQYVQYGEFETVSAGLGFACGIVVNVTYGVTCFGADSEKASLVQKEFMNYSMLSIAVGGSHACGVNSTGFLICRGENDHGKIDVPDHSPFEFSIIALGLNHTCALRRLNSYVVCWGGNTNTNPNINSNSNSNSNSKNSSSIGNSNSNAGDYPADVSFESIVAGSDFTCGLTSNNLSVVCWGEGWVRNGSNPLGFELPLRNILPGPCVRSGCKCGTYTQSDSLCFGNGAICRPCDIFTLLAPPSPGSCNNITGSSGSSPSRSLKKGLLAFAVVGSVGAFAGICSVVYCLWNGVCFGNKKIYNSVQPTITGTTGATHNGPQVSHCNSVSRSSTIRRQTSRAFRRQRSGTSSKHADREEEFSFDVLALATDNFSQENKIGAGSFGMVYKGKLLDGREVAIKRGETGQKAKKFQEKESAFDSELAFLSRLHHKHLVRLVGYCEEREEKLLVYEYMKNGALYDHLHDKKNVEKNSSFLNSWKVRIKISLDAARGIEYLHSYAVPPIIHRDIKSSNILLDANWVARVSDFGLSLMGSECESEHRPTKAAGTVGYIDPEYYGLNVVTAKSDVYGLGVVMLELLTGKRAIFKSDDNDNGTPISLVEYAVPVITSGELGNILDKRVGAPEVNEAEAVELMAYTAIHCVNLEGRERPTMTDIVANLERAVAICDHSHGSISSGSIISE